MCGGAAPFPRLLACRFDHQFYSTASLIRPHAAACPLRAEEDTAERLVPGCPAVGVEQLGRLDHRLVLKGLAGHVCAAAKECSCRANAAAQQTCELPKRERKHEHVFPAFSMPYYLPPPHQRKGKVGVGWGGVGSEKGMFWTGLHFQASSLKVLKVLNTPHPLEGEPDAEICYL